METRAEVVERIRVLRNPKYLCFRCRYSHIYKTEGAPEPVVQCTKLGEQVPGTITDCNEFQARGSLTVWEMAKLAKLIDIDEPKKAGFRKGEK